MEAVLLLFLTAGLVSCYDDGGVLLRDVQALTLHRNRYTTGRRSSPVPQLKCVGGSAGCQAFVPEVVQCVNRGWDGVDVQWECRTDMDGSYRFGHVEVSCEGFQHPGDAYVLKGSCGLEFTLELTAEGQRASRGGWGSHSGFKGFGGFGDFGSSFFSGFGGRHQQQDSDPSDSGSWNGLLGLVLLLLLAFGVYKLFLGGNSARQDDGGSAGRSAAGPPPPGGSTAGPPPPGGSTAGPPPPGFKPYFTGFSGASPGYTHNPGGWGQGEPGSMGGRFWTGMGTGGVLGYLFGRQRNQPYGYNHSSPSYRHRDPPAPPAPPATSSGTRTASGFGGTKRR